MMKLKLKVGDYVCTPDNEIADVTKVEGKTIEVRWYDKICGLYRSGTFKVSALRRVHQMAGAS